MPKISELPPSQPLNGNEIIPIVQDDETRKIGLLSILTPRIGKPRWIDGNIDINAIDATLNCQDWSGAFSATAAVSHLIDGDEDILGWNVQFEPKPILVEFAEANVWGDYGNNTTLELSPGGYHLQRTLDDGVAQYIIHYASGDVTGTLTHSGEYYEFEITEPTLIDITAPHPSSGVLLAKLMGQNSGGSARPTVIIRWNQLTVSYSEAEMQEPPEYGILTATAVIYRGGIPLKESSPITLSITEQPPQV